MRNLKLENVRNVNGSYRRSMEGGVWSMEGGKTRNDIGINWNKLFKSR